MLAAFPSSLRRAQSQARWRTRWPSSPYYGWAATRYRHLRRHLMQSLVAIAWRRHQAIRHQTKDKRGGVLVPFLLPFGCRRATSLGGCAEGRRVAVGVVEVNGAEPAPNTRRMVTDQIHVQVTTELSDKTSRRFLRTRAVLGGRVVRSPARR